MLYVLVILLFHIKSMRGSAIGLNRGIDSRGNRVEMNRKRETHSAMIVLLLYFYEFALIVR